MKIKLNNREFDCSFGLGFLGELIDVLDISYDELFNRYEKNPIKYVPVIMYESVKYALDGEIDFTKKEFMQWIDNEGGLSNKELVRFSQAFLDSIVKNVPEEKEAEQESSDTKKK